MAAFVVLAGDGAQSGLAVGGGGGAQGGEARVPRGQAGGDPFEFGSSRPLDFGHWAAHKLEQLTNYQLRHGEAVAIGIALDCTYSYLQGLLPQQDWQQIIKTLQQLGFSLYVPELAIDLDNINSENCVFHQFRKAKHSQNMTFFIKNTISCINGGQNTSF